MGIFMLLFVRQGEVEYCLPYRSIGGCASRRDLLLGPGGLGGKVP